MKCPKKMVCEGGLKRISQQRSLSVARNRLKVAHNAKPSVNDLDNAIISWRDRFSGSAGWMGGCMSTPRIFPRGLLRCSGWAHAKPIRTAAHTPPVLIYFFYESIGKAIRSGDEQGY